ncbi:MAG: type II/IV secretion system protein [Candidatus Taylorbacteria bacterium]|nr:type II/IV secretion system protein [Candidatus Taylorbacteria bacterium]
MHISEDTLKSLLDSSGLIKESEFDVASDDAKRSGRAVTDVLIGTGKISEDHLVEVLEEYYKVPIVNLKKQQIDIDVLELVPELYAKAKKAILFECDKEKGVARLAMMDPFDYETIEYVRAKLGMWVEPRLMSTASLRYGLRQYKKRIGVEFGEIISHNIRESLAIAGESDVAKTAGSVPIISILDTIVEHATSLNASDVHFEPLEKELLVRFRIDGIMQEIVSLPKAIAPILVARVEILANLQIDEHRVPQDGRFRFEMEDGSNVDIRVNVMPVFHGEKVEMRILKNSARPLTLTDLGLSSDAAETLAEEIKKPHGMILVTGPTGHGKTTTLYAILHILNTPSVNITTIEDPVEYEFPRVNQTQVNVKAGVTFANGLRALLRQNPDIIMIGEIRDNETVDIAIHAALTGHLVLSSLHTNDAPSALPRLTDMGAAPFLLSSTVNLIVAQRLVRKICTSCIGSYPIPADMKRLIKDQMKALGDSHIKKIPETVYKGKGCNVCGQSGFSGQIGIFEVFRVSDAIRSSVMKESPISEIRKQAIKEGMKTMFEDGLQKVELGVTTVEEVLRVVRE